MKKQFSSVILACLTSLTIISSKVHSQTPGGEGVVHYGSELGVMVGAPTDWLFDSVSVHQGIHTVMYPVGSTWSNATEVMYLNIVPIEDSQTIEEFIEQSITGLRQQSPNLTISSDESIELENGDVVIVRLYAGDRWD